jgi:hypothetical protein
MIGPQPIAPARWLATLTVLVLPADVRDRYREEFRTELSELGRIAQVPQAMSLLVGAIPLRNALNERDIPDSVSDGRDWRCRLGRHRYVLVQDDNPEMRGRGYLQCVRCGKPKDPPSYGPPSATTIGWAGPAPAI